MRGNHPQEAEVLPQPVNRDMRGKVTNALDMESRHGILHNSSVIMNWASKASSKVNLHNPKQAIKCSYFQFLIFHNAIICKWIISQYMDKSKVFGFKI